MSLLAVKWPTRPGRAERKRLRRLSERITAWQATLADPYCATADELLRHPTVLDGTHHILTCTSRGCMYRFRYGVDVPITFPCECGSYTLRPYAGRIRLRVRRVIRLRRSSRVCLGCLSLSCKYQGKAMSCK